MIDYFLILALGLLVFCRPLANMARRSRHIARFVPGERPPGAKDPR
ncbi:MAG: hypothetical protein ACX93P_03645 [Roseovarius sp.]|nr:hypothetical protein [Roseovarius sp.]